MASRLLSRVVWVTLLAATAGMAAAKPAPDQEPGKLIDNLLKTRPWPIVQIFAQTPGNATGSAAMGDWQGNFRRMIADYQKQIPDLVSPYHFLNGNFHLKTLDASGELLAEAGARLETLRRASLEKLGYYPQRRFMTVAQNPGGAGSGAIIDARGYVLTAAHVVARAQPFGMPVLVNVQAPSERMRRDTGLAHAHPEQARQGLGQIEYEATVLTCDRSCDLALLKIHSESTFPCLPVAEQAAPREGDTVVGFAIPDGSSQRIQSWVGRVTGRNHSQFPGENLFFVDFLIKPGYSGGPVCNLKGEVVGQSAALVAISHPNIDSEIPGRTSVALADREHAALRPLKQRPTLESRPALEWVDKQGWRLTDPVPKTLTDIGVEVGDVIVWATGRRCDRYGVENGHITCVWDEQKSGVWDVSSGKDVLGKAIDSAGVGGWLLLRLKRGPESYVAQVRIQGS